MYFKAMDRARVSQQLELGQEHDDPTGQLPWLQGANRGPAQCPLSQPGDCPSCSPSRRWPARGEVEEEQKDLVRGLVQPLLGEEGGGGDAGEGQMAWQPAPLTPGTRGAPARSPPRLASS